MALAVALAGAAGMTGCSGSGEAGKVGDRAAAGDRPLWRDEFNGPAGARPTRRHWTAELGGEWGNNELQQYTARASNVRQDGRGHLVITARRERHTGVDGVTRDYTSARLTTYRKFSFTYGRIEARIKVPAGRGLIAGFWTLGDNLHDAGWPESGEIDVVEVNGNHPRVAHASLHGPGVGEKGWAQTSTFTARRPLSHAWHTYAATWSPGLVEFSIDGRVYGRRTPAGLPGGARWAFDHPHHLLLTLSVGGPWAGRPAPSTEWPARMLVDWIRVWKR